MHDSILYPENISSAETIASQILSTFLAAVFLFFAFDFSAFV
jgi:hypothetical protein